MSDENSPPFAEEAKQIVARLAERPDKRLYAVMQTERECQKITKAVVKELQEQNLEYNFYLREAEIRLAPSSRKELPVFRTIQKRSAERTLRNVKLDYEVLYTQEGQV